jgi:hypothetical protein
MPLPASRIELLTSLRDAATKLDAEFDDFADPRAVDTHGVSPADRLGYQIGWGRLLLGWDTAEREGRFVPMPAQGFAWHELGGLAQQFYVQHREWSVVGLRCELGCVVDEIAEWVGTMSDQEVFAIGQREWAGEKWPVVKWIQVNTIAPYRSARTKIRAQRRCLESGSD